MMFLRQQRQELRELQARRTETTVFSPDGLVSATVDERGHLTGLWLDGRIYRSPDSRVFSAKVIES
ncbi:YbaB/EbfC family nucleoid-associated protein [Fodinicola feengrottensis]|nr:YbaB/EbfC family nucleoid-associated protein [Fodinicola feengrottensis]